MEMQEETTIQMTMEKEDEEEIETTTATINPETIAIVAKINEIDLATNIETAEEIARAIATTRNLLRIEEIVQSPRPEIEIMTKETEIMIEETETKTTTAKTEIKTTNAKTEIEKTLGKEIDMKTVINLLVEGIEREMHTIVLHVDEMRLV
jgi:hypothetical protein